MSVVRSESILDTRSVEEHDSLCPAAAAIGETITGSGVLCRVTGNVVTTGENPSSLKAFCWNQLPAARAEASDGGLVCHGYQNCPVWRHNREVELGEREGELFISRAST